MRSIGWYHRAVIARLKSFVDSGTLVTDQQPPRVQRYLQVQTGGGHRPQTRMDATTGRDLPIMIMAVGLTPDDAFDALEQCDSALIGWDIDPSDTSASILVRDETYPPLIPYRSVEGDERYSISPTYRLGTDR